jgi:tRNA(Ile)-lysidine synthase
MTPLGESEFAALMAPLGPFEPAPDLAVAVSGGADSLCLAWLALGWAGARGGTARGFVVDHGLRPASAAEAALTAARLAALGVPPTVLTLTGLARGPALAERARAARHAVLEQACATAGLLHLLLGHHAADQAETVAMRLLRGGTPAGLAGMAALSETARIRRLRPLLGIPPVRLRATLAAAGLAWVEDPSNADPGAERNRIRMLRGDRDGIGPATRAAVEAARLRAASREAVEAADAAWLATAADLHPEGFAVLDPHGLRPGALAALLRMLAGRAYAPPAAQVAAWSAAPRPATLGGVRIMAGPQGRFLLAREAAAMAPARPAAQDALWDGRFRVAACPPGLTVGALGDGSARFRRLSALPAAVLRTLPALRREECLVAVPHLRYAAAMEEGGVRIVFDPPSPAAGAAFFGGGFFARPGMQTPVAHPI